MKNRFGIEVKRGMRVTCAHPRGGHESGTVVRVAQEQAYGWRATMDSGMSCALDDISEARMPRILPVRTCASMASLQTIKDVTPADAWLIRHYWRTLVDRRDARAAIDKVLRTHGVEYLGVRKRADEDVYYCNAGDTYASTVIFIGPRMVVGCWGDLIEAGKIRKAVQ
jgi:hypothetical protein